MKSWDQLWLYEGFTNFVKYYCVRETSSEPKIWTDFLPNVYAHAMGMDSLANSYPIEVRI